MNKDSILINLINNLHDTSVLCIGDVMLDQFIYGEVERISPEAPVPVLRVCRDMAMLGGAGNVVRNLVALGSTPSFVSLIGDDSAGKEILQKISEHSQINPLIITETDRKTTVKTRFFGGSQQLLRSDRETLKPLSTESKERLLAKSFDLIPQAGVIILSDYGKGVLTTDVIQSLIEKAYQAHRPVLIDPKGNDYSVYRGATVVTPNRKELHEATQMPVDDDESIVSAARFLIDHCGINNVLVTRSQDGMTLVTGQGDIHHLPAQAREVFDVSGAGDTVIATLATALAGGVPLLDAARLSNVAAGIVVGKVGTAVAYISDLVQALRLAETVQEDAKIVDRLTASHRIELWRQQGYTVGFTNGCFDLLHPGHISLLKQSKMHCDRLVVGLNSDSSVHSLKGPTRPIQSESARATVLASLSTVDLVVIFDESTPLELISTLKPDTLIKGADYTVDQVVGADVVQSYGGKVYLAKLVEGQSTTATINKITQ